MLVLSVSGGKDSTAMYLLALERGLDFRAVFADTGHEHELTYEYLLELPRHTGGPVVECVRADLSGKFAERREAVRRKWPAKGVSPAVIARAVKALQPSGNPFLDMCLLRAGFPGNRYRFCTETLKVKPVREQFYEPLLDVGARITAWHGVRRDESATRMNYAATATERWGRGKYEVTIERPILDWTVGDVWAMHAKHGIKPNPLYAAGASRVGCAPCIYARNAEVAMWAEKFPERIERLREWEEIVNQAGTGSDESTFFPARRVRVPGPIHYKTHGIDAKVAAVTADTEDLPLEGGCSMPGLCEGVA